MYTSLLIVFTLSISQINGVFGFYEESIFEDEDIYTQALPPSHKGTGITAPGTKWCGPGNTATQYSDLGVQREADSCCRDHDHCTEILRPRTSLHDLNGSDWFPILKCTCEQKFINCLQSVDNLTANSLGRIYFGTRRKCFEFGYPIIDCKQYHKGTFRNRCIRYNVDNSKPKIWQFYDMPFYSNKLETMRFNTAKVEP